MAFLRSAKCSEHQVRRPRSLRWLVLLIASLLLHGIVLNWATQRIALPARSASDENVVTTELRFTPVKSATPDVLDKPRTDKPLTKPKAKSPPKPHHAAPPALPEDAQPQPEPIATADTVSDAVPLPPPVDTASETSESVPATPAVMDDPAPPATTPAEAGQKAMDTAPPKAAAYRIDPPPSAELKYDVKASKNGQNTYGSGKIRWESAGGRYTVTGETSVLFFTVLNFHSEGTIDEFGVSPVLYSEKRFRRAETNTHFSREHNAISFSSSTVSYPRQGGEQDRASILWQLAAIGRGNSEQFHPDAEFGIFVAGTRDGETWRIRVIGQESVDVGLGPVTAWHMVRLPRATSYDQKLDFWLAPDQQWYPVKIRFTEANGDSLDMTLANMNLTKAE